jgi:hypothetical protein
MVFDGNWNVTVLPNQQLAPGWNALHFTIPAAVATVRVLGLQINDGGAWAGRLVLDSVAF